MATILARQYEQVLPETTIGANMLLHPRSFNASHRHLRHTSNNQPSSARTRATHHEDQGRGCQHSRARTHSGACDCQHAERPVPYWPRRRTHRTRRWAVRSRNARHVRHHEYERGHPRLLHAIRERAPSHVLADRSVPTRPTTHRFRKRKSAKIDLLHRSARASPRRGAICFRIINTKH